MSITKLIDENLSLIEKIQNREEIHGETPVDWVFYRQFEEPFAKDLVKKFDSFWKDKLKRVSKDSYKIQAPDTIDKAVVIILDMINEWQGDFAQSIEKPVKTEIEKQYIYGKVKADTDVKAKRVLQKRAPDATIGIGLDKVDKDIINFMDSSTTFYTGKVFAEHADEMERTIRSAFVTDGLGNRTMKKALIDVTGIATEKAWHMDMIARTSANRIANWSRLVTFRSRGVHTIEIVATNDRRTCPYCEYMDGTTWTVEKAYEQIQEVTSADPSALPDIIPFVYDKSIPETLSEDAFAKVGSITPPYHCHCRCLFIIDSFID